MNFLFHSFVRIVLLAAFVLVWGCAAPPVKPVTEKPVKKEVRKAEKKKVKVQKQKKRQVKRKTEQAIQPGPVKEADVPADAGEEPIADEDDPKVFGRMMFHYDYYPDVEVYFDTIRHLYFYFDKGRWMMSVALPTNFQENLGRSIRLKIKSDRPYVEHDEHVRKYPSTSRPDF